MHNKNDVHLYIYNTDQFILDNGNCSFEFNIEK